MREIAHIIIHCAATPNGDARFGFAEIDKMHRDRGWRKIGYHRLITVDGTEHIGRMDAEIGAHVEGSNANSIGVCMIGTDRFTVEQWEQLRTCIEELQEHYPAADVKGHRDYSPDLNGDGMIEPREWVKVCPGFEVKAWLAAGMSPAWNPAHLFEEA